MPERHDSEVSGVETGCEEALAEGKLPETGASAR
jgi:hypothetical protein